VAGSKRTQRARVLSKQLNDRLAKGLARDRTLQNRAVARLTISVSFSISTDAAEPLSAIA
jgi:hypothetical protein